MQEEFLHFVWQFRRFNALELTTTAGEAVEISHTGRLNTADGPDFMDARIKIGDTVWVGHVEIHLKSSDWFRHKHQHDPKYNNVILHVVFDHDLPDNTFPFATISLNGRIPGIIRQRYEQLMFSGDSLPCHYALLEVDDFTLSNWKERLLFERWEEKLRKMEVIHQKFQGDLDRLAFVWLSRYFGTGPNMDNFQLWAESIEPKWIAKLKDNPLSIEALFFGQAGFLKASSEDEYTLKLQQEYQFLQHKWQLQPLPPTIWMWKRARPSSFPTVRMALLSALSLEHFPSYPMLINFSLNAATLAGVASHPYWTQHYRFAEPSVFKEKHIGRQLAESIIINVVVPLQIFQYRLTQQESWLEMALQHLYQLPAEENAIVKAVAKGNFIPQNAADSQAFIQMKKHYCDAKKCLQCAIGHKILRPGMYTQSQDDVNLQVHEACA